MPRGARVSSRPRRSRTLAEWPNTYWAERIEIGVSREFVSALRQQLPGWAFCDTNCGDQVPALSLQVDLVPMDYLRAAQKLQARARITVSSGAAVPQVLQTQELPYELPAASDSAQAQAQAIAELIRQVAPAAAALVKAARPELRSGCPRIICCIAIASGDRVALPPLSPLAAALSGNMRKLVFIRICATRGSQRVQQFDR